jgi:hypothetical protein
MASRFSLPRPRRARFHGHAALALCLASLLMAAGCAANQLNTFKKRAAQGDLGWIASQPVDCRKATAVCGQLHLMKGDACFQLARSGSAPADNDACAADELERGLALTPSWPDKAIQRQVQENLCEALRNLHGIQSGEAARQTLTRFEAASEALHRLAPESVPAVYYLATVRLRQVQPMLMDINAATRVPVCSRLKRTVTRVLVMMKTASQAPPPEWDRFADRVQRLTFDLGTAIRVAQCR